MKLNKLRQFMSKWSNATLCHDIINIQWTRYIYLFIIGVAASVKGV